MPKYSKSSEELIEHLRKLPGIGQKSAERIALHIIRSPVREAEQLAGAIKTARENIRCCERCYNLCEGRVCPVCSDPARDQKVLCVVAEPHDAASIEKLGVFKGLYHVLQGNLSPLDNIGPEDIRVPQLLKRVEKGGFDEVIIATGCDSDGEQTALYISRLLKKFKCRVSRIARGLPVGSSLEYADSATLRESLEGRRQV